MKKDTEVKVYMQERRKGRSQRLAAARAGMSERTARRYERAGKLPSQLKQPRSWRTRANPFEEDWPWVVEYLERDPALQGTTLFALLCARHPGRYRPTQVRTLQRHIAAWRALHGPEREVIGSASTHAGRAGPIRFYLDERHGDYAGRRTLSPSALPLRADLLECGSGLDLSERKL